MNRQETQRSAALWLLPLALVVVGTLLLLQNYLLIEFNVMQLWPLLLVVFGLQIILRGDLGVSRTGQSFGITRGSVESGTLRANSGELDLHIRVLQREGRLIAGQYTARSRPELVADGSRAILTMQRGRTWLLSLADWEVGLAGDLPWKLLLSTYLGEIEADFRGLIVDEASIASGFGDIRITGPDSPTGLITVHSTFGDIRLTVPEHMEAAITVNGSPFFGRHINDARWQQIDRNRYVTSGYAAAVDPLEFHIRGTFGDFLLS